MAAFIAAMPDFQQRLCGTSVMAAAVAATMSAAAVAVVIMPMTMIVVTTVAAAMAMIVMATAVAVIIVTAAVTMIVVRRSSMIGHAMTSCAGREHAAAFTGGSAHDHRLHEIERAYRDGVAEEKRSDQPPIGGILERRKMQRRVVIDHRRQNERHEIHEDGANRRCHQRPPIRNAPRPIKDDHRRQYEINLGKSGLEKLHRQIRVIHYVLHQAPLENITTTPVAGAHSNARFRGFRKNFLLRARKASAGPRPLLGQVEMRPIENTAAGRLRHSCNDEIMTELLQVLTLCCSGPPFAAERHPAVV